MQSLRLYLLIYSSMYVLYTVYRPDRLYSYYVTTLLDGVIFIKLIFTHGVNMQSVGKTAQTK
jgi:hypothetical protein